MDPKAPPSPPPEPKKSLPGAAKLGIGCGITALILAAALTVAIVAGVRIARKQLASLTAEYREMGFDETVRGQKLTVRKEITEKTLLLGQLVQVYGDCSTDLAIVAQVAEVHGSIDGKLFFKGQVLRVMPTASIKDGADIVAQSFVNEGNIEGEISERTQQSSGLPAN